MAPDFTCAGTFAAAFDAMSLRKVRRACDSWLGVRAPTIVFAGIFRSFQISFSSLSSMALPVPAPPISSKEETFPYARWEAELPKLRAKYQSAEPFPHIVLDDFTHAPV